MCFRGQFIVGNVVKTQLPSYNTAVVVMMMMMMMMMIIIVII